MFWLKPASSRSFYRHRLTPTLRESRRSGEERKPTMARRKRQGRRLLGLPVLLSLLLHGLLLFWFNRVRLADASPAPRPILNGVITLDAGPRCQSVVVPGPVEVEDPPGMATFPVTVVDRPPPQPVAMTAPTPAPQVQAPAPGTLPGLPARGTPGQPAAGLPGGAGRQGSGGERLFPSVAPGQSVVFVLDRSLSMGLRDAFNRARRELLATLEQLPPTARFQVVAYNRQAEPLWINGQAGLLTADAVTLQQVRLALEALAPMGSTDHVHALQRALLLRPDLVYFVTDANDLSVKNVFDVTRVNQRPSVIQVISLNPHQESRPDCPLRQLASLNRGNYRRVAPTP